MAGQRYDHLLEIVDRVRPRSIIEIGVARIVRAREMSERALAQGEPVHYIGYDVFETMPPEFHEAAYNHKRVEPVHWCRKKLWHVQQRYPLFTYDLVVGDTRFTLHNKPVVADMAFIDGDHRVECIRGDYRALAGCKVVCFDDYFTADERGIPDTKKYGCNRVIDELSKDSKLKIEVLRQADPGKEAGASQIVAVWQASCYVPPQVDQLHSQ